MKQKNTFKKLLAGISIILALLPVIVTFSAVMTRFLNTREWYLVLQNVVVPFEARIVSGLLNYVNISSFIIPNSHFALFLEKGPVLMPVDIEWNCLGWQSMVLLGITIATGLRGNWDIMSKTQVVVFGFVGTFLVNILRMVLIISLAYYVDSFAALIVHDYFAALVALLWLLFYWWFSYRYILVPKEVVNVSE